MTDNIAADRARRPAPLPVQGGVEELLEQLCIPLRERSDYRAGYQAGLNCAADRAELGEAKP